MVMTDPIADFLTRIRNANMVRHESLEVPSSNMKVAIAKNNNNPIIQIVALEYFFIQGPPFI